MKIFDHEVFKRDFVPPLLLKLLRKKSVSEHATKYFHSDRLNSYSQYNEDLLIDVILKCKQNGFYVDIGANDPVVLNNTKRFYDRGWTGLNIEPNPELFENICKNRDRDLNLNIGIDEKTGIIPFYVMSSHTLSSFDKAAALKGEEIHRAELEKIINVRVLPLKDVFHEYIRNQHIDFMTVDTEGYDLKVLISNDWAVFCPALIMVETGDNATEIDSYLMQKDYLLVFNNYTNSIYLHKPSMF